MGMTYDSRNRKNLDQLAPNTKAKAYQWYQKCIDLGADVLIYETVRTIEQQKKNVASGASQTMKSYHLVGQALDFVPIVNGKALWDYSAYTNGVYGQALAYAKQIGFEWGGDWQDFVDTPHLQFNYNGYDTDKSLDTNTQEQDDSIPYKVIIPNTAFWQARSLVIEFETKGYKCYGVAGKQYNEGQEPQDNDPYQFVIECNLEEAKALVIELQTRGYDRTYGEQC